MIDEILIILLLSMKKRDNLLQIIKKEKEFGLLAFLQAQDILSLALTSKKYYAILVATLEGQRLDSQQTTKQTKTKTQKNKQKPVKEEQPTIPLEIQVEIDKIPLHKFMKRSDKNGGQWQRTQKLENFNSYLSKKLQSKTCIFYQNTLTKQLIFINRSLVDPALNYNKGGFGEDFVNSDIYEHIFEGQVTQQDFSSMDGILKRQRQILQKIQTKKQEQSKLDQTSFQDQFQKSMKIHRIGIILCFGGSFSFGIFENSRCVVHRSDHKYVCRQKAGERQFNRDKQSGSGIQSMGSQIRRDQEKKHVINVGEILKQNKDELAQCEIIFLQAPGMNRLFVINENQNLDGLQNRLRSVCVTAKKANFTQVQALFKVISQVHMVKYLTSEETKVKSKQRKQK